jgi:hypothetical protein
VRKGWIHGDNLGLLIGDRGVKTELVEFRPLAELESVRKVYMLGGGVIYDIWYVQASSRVDEMR